MARGDVQIVNPAKKWFKWSGGEGKLSYYDKELKENVEVATPFMFLVLDSFSTVKGYDESRKEVIYTNEVKDITKQQLVVKVGNEVVVSGLYKDIKPNIPKGGGYAQSVYIAYKDESGKLVIGNILMAGSSFGGGIHKPADKNMKDVEVGGWLDFCKIHGVNIEKKAVVLEGKDERMCTNGNVKFYAPKFSLKDISEETDKEAIALTQDLKEYMKHYFAKTQGDIQEQQVAAQVAEAHAKTFGNNPATPMTPQEKAFLVKPEVEDTNLQETPFAEIDNFGDDNQELPF